MSKYRIFWSEPALSMLGENDRYTRKNILIEFCRLYDDLFKKSGTKRISDTKEKLFFTPMLNNYFNVVWHLNPKIKALDVIAIIEGSPTKNQVENLIRKKEKEIASWKKNLLLQSR